MLPMLFLSYLTLDMGETFKHYISIGYSQPNRHVLKLLGPFEIHFLKL